MNLIVDAGKETIEARATPIQIGRAATDGVIPHQTLDATPADTLAVALQARVNAWAAVGLSTFVVHLANTLK